MGIYKVTESETLLPFYSRQKELSFSTVSWEVTEAATVRSGAAVNAAVSCSLWMRELSDNWWELLLGAEDLREWLPLFYQRRHSCAHARAREREHAQYRLLTSSHSVSQTVNRFSSFSHASHATFFTLLLVCIVYRMHFYLSRFFRGN